MFALIHKHPVLFFWLSLSYMLVCSIICEVYIEPNAAKWIQAIGILPINFITWPVAYTLLKGDNWKTLNFIDRRFVFLLPILSAALPFALFIWG